MALSFLLSAFVTTSVYSLFPAEIKELQESRAFINPKQYLHTQFTKIHSKPTTISGSASKTSKLRGADTGSLSVSPSTVTSDTEWITVSWANISYTSKYDWIGLFNASAGEDSYAAPPIKYQYICPAYNDCYYAPSHGSLRFKLLNRRTAYVFAYVTESNPYREIKGVSPVISYKEEVLYEPMHVHIAVPSAPINAKCGSSHSCMQVMWVQKAIEKPTIKYGISEDNLQWSVLAANRSKVSKDDYCGQQSGLPAGTTGYFDTGYMITAYLLTLSPGTQYFYQVGDENFGWTDVRSFRAPPKYGNMVARDDGKDLRLIIFGDLGNVAIDYSMHHSWDFGNRGEIYTINTTHAMKLFSNGSKENTDALIHIGDISYAVGFLAEWDTFFHQIEPVASNIPWMTGIGNHEYSWTGEWKPPSVSADAYGNADGGGECGVPYNFYFPFANANQEESRWSQYDVSVVQPWYVFDYGTVRSIIMSTEHDFGKGSAQYDFISDALKRTDRDLFPWIFIAGHRGMYANCNFDGDTTTAQYMIDSLDDLLAQYGVALGFWGHQHSYGRTCPVFKSECKKEGEATVHLTVGMAGYSLSKKIEPLSYTVFQNNTVYGFVHLTMHNETVLTGKFVNANTTKTVDEFQIINPYKSN
eukprot:245890_1